MYGFKPQHARGKPVQNFADGGLVQRVKRAVGLDDEHNARVAEYRANKAAAAAQAPVQRPTSSAAPAPPTKALSDYSGATAMQRREKELGLKDGGLVPRGFKPGGLIRGPGTGTSDSIETEKEPGTFIMPADSTEAIGPDALEDMGEKVPVRLSNGEFEVPPEQVQALGEAVLTVMRNATHQPAGEAHKAPTSNGFAPAQHFASGGVVKDEEKQRMARERGAQQQPNGFFPNNSPDAGASIYGGVGPANGFGSSGKLATGAEKVIAAQPPVQQLVLSQRPTPITQQRAAPAPTPAAAPLLAPTEPVAQGNAGTPLGQMHSTGARSGGEILASGLERGARSFFGSFQKQPEAQPAAPAVSNPTDARLATGAQRAPAGFAPAIKPQVTTAPSVPQQAPVTAQRMAPPPHSPAFDFDNYQPAPGQGAFRNEQTGEVTRLQDGPSPTRETRIWKEPNVLPRSDARPAAPRQDVRAPVLNPNGGVFAAMTDFTNQTGDAVNAIAANKGARNDRKDDLDQTRVDADIAATGARLSLDGQRVGLDAQRIAQGIAQGNESNRIAGEELSMRREAAGFQTRAAKRLEDLQASYQSAKTPEERNALARQIREISGKGEGNLRDNFMTVGGGQEWDAQAGVMRNVPQRLVDLRTGQETGGPQAPALPKGMKRQIGTSNGRPVYEDMNGKQVIAKG
jgi:hypothetical protein